MVMIAGRSRGYVCVSCVNVCVVCVLLCVYVRVALGGLSTQCLICL